jgi:Xaa-Pro aminopeptidase
MTTYPFDAKKLEALMEEAKLDLLLASTRHNIRYLTGGRYHHFFLRSTRLGPSQYLAVAGLPRGRFQDAFYVGRRQEQRELQAMPLWIGQQYFGIWETKSTAGQTVEAVKKLGLETGTIGVEMPFLPADAYVAIQQGLPHARLVDATALLGELRAIKRPEEIAILREAHEAVAEAIHATFRWGRDGVTTQALNEHIRPEIEQRGPDFIYCFTTAGPSVLRAPSQQRWTRGNVLELDCGGELRDYISDIARMGCMGKPSPLADDMLNEILAIQERARALVRPGIPCAEVYLEGERVFKASRFAAGGGAFEAHGLGIVSHEPPVIRPNNPRHLEAGMVLSIETDFEHPEVGRVKIEDTVVVTPNGPEGLGDLGRQWTIVDG